MEKEIEEIHHSKLSMVSFGFGKFINEFFVMSFGALVFYFYEDELGLDPVLAMTGYIIFALWNAINDPLIGYVLDRPFKFTKRWGRRFPWVIIGGIPWILSYALIFAPPIGGSELLIFAWLVFSTCLFDTFASIFNVSFYSLFPDKFRSASERRNASTISTLVAALGTALGAIIPSLFYTQNIPSTYIMQGFGVAAICMIALVLAIPGSREDQVRIDCFLERCEEGMERQPFFKELVRCLKHKNFMVYIITFTLYQSLVSLIIGSIPYVTEHVLGKTEEDIILIMAMLLIGMIVSMPLWSLIAHKTNNDTRTMLIASFYLALTAFILFFITDYTIMMIGVFIFGTGEGGFWVMMSPIFANSIDESIVETSQRREGVYNGILTFVGRAALVIQALSIGLVHIITQYDPLNISPLAKFGIQVHFALIPSILMLIGAIVFGLFFKLSPEDVDKNREKLIQMKI